MPGLNKNSGLKISGVAWGLDVGLGDRTRINLCVHKLTFKHSIFASHNILTCAYHYSVTSSPSTSSLSKRNKVFIPSPNSPPLLGDSHAFHLVSEQVTCLKDPTISSVKTLADLG